MRIVDLHIHEVTVGRIYTTIPAIAHTQQQDALTGVGSRYFLFELETDNGLRGIGEISDVGDGMNYLSTDELRELLAGVLIGKDPLKRRRVWDEVCEAVPQKTHPDLRQLMTFSVDMALMDLAGKHFGVPLYEFFGGLYWKSLPISWVGYIRGADLLEGEIQEKVREGFRHFKLKVGDDMELACERVRTLRRIAPSDAYLKVDARGAWEEKEAIENSHRLAELGVDAIETPIQEAAPWRGNDRPDLINDNVDEMAQALARVRAASPIEIIEHVGNLADGFALALIKHKAVDIFNVIPCQSGSLHRAQRLIHLAEVAEIPVLLGSTVELGPGTAAALHLGVASKSVCIASDLVGPGLLADDVGQPPLRYEAGRLRAPDVPGLGVTLDATRVDRYSPGTFER